MPRFHKYNVDKIIPLNDTVSEIVLSSINEENRLEFLPGQYTYIYMEDDKQQPYSIASSPDEDHLKFIIYNGNDDKNLDFFRKSSTTPINISEPQGEAYYRENENNILAVCKGLGIVPVMSIIDALALKAEDKKISLFNVVASEDDLIFEEYFKKVQSKINFEYKNFITDGSYNLEELNTYFNSMHYELSNYDFYVFGSNLFVLDIYKELLPYCKNNFYSDVNTKI